MVISNSLPGFLVSTFAVKDLLLLSGSESVIESSMLLTIRTTVEALLGASTGTFRTANCGLTSMGFQSVPLICSVIEGWVLSLQLMVTVLSIAPCTLAVLTWSGIVPVWPGSALCVQSPEVVQPQWGWTAVISSRASPVLVNTKVYLIGSPAFAFPKS